MWYEAALNTFTSLKIMEEKVYERRLQKQHGSFVLTIPKTIIEKHLKIKNGQSIKFYGYPDRVVLVPSNTDTDLEPDKRDRYRAALDKIMDNETDEKKITDMVKTNSKASRLEKLRLK